jgi:UDP-glucose 4-epimerase
VRVAVTGGSGFIGSHVVDALLARGLDVRLVDRHLSPWHEESQAPTAITDLRDPGAVMRALAGCDAVLHLAAAADVNDVVADPVAAEEVNTRGTMNVLEAARRVGAQRVVYASTIWVYGEQPDGVVDEDSFVGVPQHFYTATKLAGESYVRSLSRLHGFEHTILRFGIPYGPRAREAAVLPTFVRKAHEGQPITVAGGGAQSRRFVYVEDLADGVARALAPEAANRIYNLVSEEDVTILQVAELVRELVRPVELVQVDGRAADFRGAVVSAERAARELRWRASTPFREGARRYVEWFLAAEEARAAAPRSQPAALHGPEPGLATT